MDIYVVNLLGALDGMETDPLELSAFEIFLLLSSVQMTWRAPNIGNELRDQLYKLGHLLQHQFDDAPAIAVLAETGWDTSLDVATGDRR